MSLTFALQSLLARHEAYVLEAEEERRKMAASIDRLESDKKELEAANARTIEENRVLLDQLEGLNTIVSDSEAHILSLNATLRSTRQELDRLNALAARTSQLEAQLSSMETDQTKLHEKLASSEKRERSAVQRRKDAERTISTLQEQVDRIEAEAKDESERHAEVMSRFERRQAVEKQLESAAGRLKGAAAAATLGKAADGKSHVVSHFVKDILADNASLQMGIMELREMLTGSNVEVQKLREQMMLHQEVPPDHHQASAGMTLEEDLGRSTAPEMESIPALHVHHHYHEASKVEAPGRRRSTGPRRVRRRRSFVNSGTSTPRSGLDTPRSSRTPSAETQPCIPSPAATILSQTSASIPPSRDPYPHRLSIQSTNTRSSTAYSMESSSSHPSMFDFLSESSRPTSPESVDVFSYGFPPLSTGANLNPLPTSPSPTIRPLDHHASPGRGGNNTTNQLAASSRSQPDHETIIEEPEHDPPFSVTSAETNDRIYAPSPGLRRSASHESILHIAASIPPKQLREHPSRLFRGAATLQFRSSLGPSSSSAAATSTVSSKPVVSATPVTAARAVSSSGAMSTLSSSLHQTSTIPANDRSTTRGKRLGGWVWGKWGVAPMASTGNLRVKAAGAAMGERPTGVNQKGSLRALRLGQVRGVNESQVVAEGVDEGLLRETLGEEG
ncbi:MAG: hypothetical protein LQ338_007409 [Usnochroma carphineum]|nr:MAG: hypothetical protein LQ338_007409 [Usnochroma carphineum]